MASFIYKDLYINNFYSIAGKNENNGILKNVNKYINDFYYGEKTIEDSEIKMQKEVLNNLINTKTDLIVGGDLMNQITATSSSNVNNNISFLGVYNACATFVESMIIISNFINGKSIKEGISITSSHNLASEKQFRFPIEYGAQKPSYTTFTTTGSVGCVLSKNKSNIKIKGSTIGSIVDMGIKDANNMGAVMAPAAVKTLKEHLDYTKTSVNDYDIILTGDLGSYGTKLFKILLKEDYNINIKNHIDAGSIIYKKEQEKYSGGSGPVCLPLILFNNILQNKKYKKILAIATGSLHSPMLVNQKHSIPSIAHLISLEVTNDNNI
ncbi:MAG: stage V sporulation protein AD [Bacilli bacterium]|nr:stage V sporulation protein AD [Bacilli bacterium]